MGLTQSVAGLIYFDELETHVARLKINAKRRTADRRDYNELAEYLQKAEPESKIPLAELVSKLARIPLPTVYANLDSKFKDSVKAAAGATVTIAEMKSESVRIPEPVAASVKEAVNGLQQLVKEEPKKREERRGCCQSDTSPLTIKS